jgi:hypothetical protein
VGKGEWKHGGMVKMANSCPRKVRNGRGRREGVRGNHWGKVKEGKGSRGQGTRVDRG